MRFARALRDFHPEASSCRPRERAIYPPTTEDRMVVAEWVENVNKLGTVGIAAVSAGYAWMQYRRAKRWKATDLAATLLEKLDTDRSLALATQALDWGVGPLIIPEEYRPLFRKDAQGDAPAVMDHDPKVLAIAMEPNLNPETLKDPRGLVYRYCFIKLFSYLDHVYKLLRDGQLHDADIEDLKYWVEQIRCYRYAPNKAARESVFQPALPAWNFDHVVRLGERLDVKPWTHARPTPEAVAAPDTAVIAPA
ncbi:MAG TPA: hypothetical protein VF092_18965 [Longimicrobium sp.]